MVSNAEIIDYVSARIVNDLEFLANHGFISREDQNLIRSRLPGAQVNTPQPQRAPVSMPNPMVSSYNAPGQNQPGPPMTTNFPLKQISGGSPVDVKRAVPPPPSPRRRPPDYCKALWDYNADMSEPADLMFRKGDTIELVEETNNDWWTGICRGRSGLFPSNHVQRIPYDPHLFSTPPDGGTPPPSQDSSATLYEKPRYPTQQMNPGPSSMPPQMPSQQQQGMPPYVGNAPSAPPEPQKKGKFGKVGGQLGNSLVNGVGFGAGAAIGSGIIDAIF